MEKKKPKPLIASDDYQKFAKKKKISLFDTALNAEGYQNFEYNKDNIPEAVKVSTKIYDKLSRDGGLFSDGGDIETQKQTEKAKTEPSIQNKKALSLVEQIKNPSRKGEKDSQLGFRKVKGKIEFYLSIGNHEVPFPIEKYGGIKILNDASSQAYQEPKEKVIREYERNLKNSNKPATKAEQEAATKAAEASIKD